MDMDIDNLNHNNRNQNQTDAPAAAPAAATTIKKQSRRLPDLPALFQRSNSSTKKLDASKNNEESTPAAATTTTTTMAAIPKQRSVPNLTKNSDKHRVTSNHTTSQGSNIPRSEAAAAAPLSPANSKPQLLSSLHPQTPTLSSKIAMSKVVLSTRREQPGQHNHNNNNNSSASLSLPTVSGHSKTSHQSSSSSLSSLTRLTLTEAYQAHQQALRRRRQPAVPTAATTPATHNSLPTLIRHGLDERTCPLIPEDEDDKSLDHNESENFGDFCDVYSDNEEEEKNDNDEDVPVDRTDQSVTNGANNKGGPLRQKMTSGKRMTLNQQSQPDDADVSTSSFASVVSYIRPLSSSLHSQTMHRQSSISSAMTTTAVSQAISSVVEEWPNEEIKEEDVSPKDLKPPTHYHHEDEDAAYVMRAVSSSSAKPSSFSEPEAKLSSIVSQLRSINDIIHNSSNLLRGTSEHTSKTNGLDDTQSSNQSQIKSGRITSRHLPRDSHHTTSSRTPTRLGNSKRELDDTIASNLSKTSTSQRSRSTSSRLRNGLNTKECDDTIGSSTTTAATDNRSSSIVGTPSIAVAAKAERRSTRLRSRRSSTVVDHPPHDLIKNIKNQLSTSGNSATTTATAPATETETEEEMTPLSSQPATVTQLKNIFSSQYLTSQAVPLPTDPPITTSATTKKTTTTNRRSIRDEQQRSRRRSNSNSGRKQERSSSVAALLTSPGHHETSALQKKAVVATSVNNSRAGSDRQLPDESAIQSSSRASDIVRSSKLEEKKQNHHHHHHHRTRKSQDDETATAATPEAVIGEHVESRSSSRERRHKSSRHRSMEELDGLNKSSRHRSLSRSKHRSLSTSHPSSDDDPMEVDGSGEVIVFSKPRSSSKDDRRNHKRSGHFGESSSRLYDEPSLMEVDEERVASSTTRSPSKNENRRPKKSSRQVGESSSHLEDEPKLMEMDAARVSTSKHRSSSSSCLEDQPRPIEVEGGKVSSKRKSSSRNEKRQRQTSSIYGDHRDASLSNTVNDLTSMEVEGENVRKGNRRSSSTSNRKTSSKHRDRDESSSGKGVEWFVKDQSNGSTINQAVKDDKNDEPASNHAPLSSSSVRKSRSRDHTAAIESPIESQLERSLRNMSEHDLPTAATCRGSGSLSGSLETDAAVLLSPQPTNHQGELSTLLLSTATKPELRTTTRDSRRKSGTSTTSSDRASSTERHRRKSLASTESSLISSEHTSASRSDHHRRRTHHHHHHHHQSSSHHHVLDSESAQRAPKDSPMNPSSMTSAPKQPLRHQSDEDLAEALLEERPLQSTRKSHKPERRRPKPTLHGDATNTVSKSPSRSHRSSKRTDRPAEKKRSRPDSSVVSSAKIPAAEKAHQIASRTNRPAEQKTRSDASILLSTSLLSPRDRMRQGVMYLEPLIEDPILEHGSNDDSSSANKSKNAHEPQARSGDPESSGVSSSLPINSKPSSAKGDQTDGILRQATVISPKNLGVTSKPNRDTRPLASATEITLPDRASTASCPSTVLEKSKLVVGSIGRLNESSSSLTIISGDGSHTTSERRSHRTISRRSGSYKPGDKTVSITQTPQSAPAQLRDEVSSVKPGKDKLSFRSVEETISGKYDVPSSSSNRSLLQGRKVTV